MTTPISKTFATKLSVSWRRRRRAALRSRLEAWSRHESADVAARARERLRKVDTSPTRSKIETDDRRWLRNRYTDRFFATLSKLAADGDTTAKKEIAAMLDRDLETVARLDEADLALMTSINELPAWLARMESNSWLAGEVVQGVFENWFAYAGIAEWSFAPIPTVTPATLARRVVEFAPKTTWSRLADRYVARP